MQSGTNVLGHFLFLKLLYPLLAASSSPSSLSRMVWTSSSVQLYFSPPVKYVTLEDGDARRKMNVGQLYYQSKFCSVLLLFRVARTSLNDGMVAIVVDPGNIKSDRLQRHLPSIAQRTMVCINIY